MAYNSRQSNMFRSSQHTKTPGSVVKKKQQQQQLDHDLSLTTDDIVSCLEELQIAFTKEDMSKPSPARVQILFEHFVGDLMGTRKDVVEPILVPAIEDQEFPEMLHDAAMLMTFFKSVLTLMTEVTVSDFTFNDINKPESERLRIVLSSVINFLRFRVGKMDFPDQVNLKSELVRESGDRLYMENQDLKMRIQNLQTQRRRDESAIEEARETNLKLAEELRAFDARQHGATEELNNIKLEKQKIISKMKEVQTHLECTQRECTRIQSYIVDSPEKLQQVIDDLGETLSKERDAVEAAVRQGRALMISADSFGVVEADVTVCIKSMEECDNVLMKLEECARKVQRQEEFLHAKEMEVKEANRTDNRIKRTLETLQLKITRARETAAAKLETAKLAKEKLKDEYNELVEVKATVNREFDKHNMKTERLLKKMADVKEGIEEEIRAAKIEYDKLEAHIHLYMSEMDQQMRF